MLTVDVNSVPRQYQAEADAAVASLARSIERLDTHAGRGESFADVYEALAVLLESTGHQYASLVARRRALTRARVERARR